MNLTNRGKKIIKIAVILILCYLCIREFTPLDFPFYKANSSWKTNSSYTSNGMRYDLKHQADTLDLLKANEGNDIYINYYGLYDNEEDFETEKNSINVIISKDVDVSLLRFVPLLKYVKFEFYNSYSWNRRIYKNGKIMITSDRGSVSVKGNTTIYGLFSAKRTSKMIDNIVTNEIRKAVKEKIDTKFELLSED